MTTEEPTLSSRTHFLAVASRGRITSSGSELVGTLGILLALALLFGALSIASSSFLTSDNLIGVLKQAAPIGIMAVGQTILMISGGFDLSIGAVYSMCGSMAAILWVDGLWAGSFIVALLAGATVGLANGLIVSLLRVNPFIATLATALIIRSLTIPLTDSSIIIVDDSGFKALGNTRFLDLPLQVWAFGFALILGSLVLRKTTFGRYVYAIGGNYEASRLAGLPVRTIRISAFVICGLAAAVAGIINASQLGIGGSQPGVGAGLEFAVIAAVVVGGTSLFGGRGAIWRTFAGVCLLAFLQNGFNLLNIGYAVQQAVMGAVIVVAVGLDALARRHERG